MDAPQHPAVPVCALSLGTSGLVRWKQGLHRTHGLIDDGLAYRESNSSRRKSMALLLPIGLLAEEKPFCVAIFDGDGVSALPLIAAIEKAKDHSEVGNPEALCNHPRCQKTAKLSISSEL